MFDKTYGIKLFADKAFYALEPKSRKHPSIVPFLLKNDAAAYAAKHGGKVADYTEVLTAASVGR